MKTPARYFNLVSDALANRHMEGSGCFWSNRDCRLLQEAGPPALPAMEAIMLEEALPFYHCSTDSLHRKLPGLGSLLVTYLAIGNDHEADRVFGFFNCLYGSLRIEAMRAINVVCLCRRPTIPIPRPLMVTIRALADVANGSMREVADWLLKRATG
jgi:hypothetical protein